MIEVVVIQMEREERVEESKGSAAVGTGIRGAQSVEQVVPAELLEEGRRQVLPTPITMRDFPNCDFFFKLVAKIDGRFFSIFDGNTEYKIGEMKHQPVLP